MWDPGFNVAGGWREIMKMTIILRGVITVTLYFGAYLYGEGGR
jgi:hypothetical protein